MVLNQRPSIDCDVHIKLPNARELLPYLNDYWRAAVIDRNLGEFELGSYPPGLPIAVRPEWRENFLAAYSFDAVSRAAVGPAGADYAILHCVSGVQGVFDEHFGRAFSSAINSWIVSEWLDRDPRLRASIVVPMQNPRAAAEDIEARAADRRFVQVLMPATGDMPYGRSYYWPIYEAAQKHGLPIGIHAGGLRRSATTSIGWSSYFIEEYASNSHAFEAQLLSMITEGVFAKFHDLRVVLIESGFSWLPAFVWRLDKTWRGIRGEVPWVKRKPSEIIRDHVRLTLQPVDVPTDAKTINRFMEMLGSDRLLLYSTDYPHWHFDHSPVPAELDDRTKARILRANPLETYKSVAAMAFAESVT